MMRLPMKPSQTPAGTATLPRSRAKASAVASTSSRTLSVRITSRASSRARARRSAARPPGRGRAPRRRSRSRRDTRCWWRGSRPGGRAVELGEDRALDLHVLEDRLDHQIGAGERGIVGGAGEPGEARGVTGLVDDTPLQAVVQVAARLCRGPGQAPPSSRSIITTSRPASRADVAMPAPMVPPPTTPTVAVGQRRWPRAPGSSRRRARRRRCGASARDWRAVAQGDEPPPLGGQRLGRRQRRGRRGLPPPPRPAPPGRGRGRGCGQPRPRRRSRRRPRAVAGRAALAAAGRRPRCQAPAASRSSPSAMASTRPSSRRAPRRRPACPRRP